MTRTTLLATTAVLSAAVLSATAAYASIDSGLGYNVLIGDIGPTISNDDGSYETARRGRGRGRGGDRDRSDNRDRDDDRDRGDRSDDRDDDSGSGRDRPRIPGGSGCDDPGDVAEHAECRV